MIVFMYVSVVTSNRTVTENENLLV